MTSSNGDASPPALLRAGTGTISGSSAVPGGVSVSVYVGYGGGDGGRSMKRGKEPALAGDFSATTVGSPPSLNKSPKGRGAEAEGSKKKRKKATFDASTSCSQCGNQFKNHRALCGHMRVHKNQQLHKEQIQEAAWALLNLRQGTLNKMEGSEKKGDGSAAAEVGASSSVVEAQRKKIHMKLDLNSEAPDDDEV